MKRPLLILLAFFLPAMAHAQSWSTLPVDLAIPMDTSTPGTSLTTTIGNAGTVSSVCAVGTECYFESLPAGAFEVGANQGCSNLGPVQMNGAGGTLYPAGSMAYNNYAHLDSANNDIGNFGFSGPPTTSRNITVTMCMTTSFPDQSNGNDWDMLMIQDGSGLYAVWQFNDECTHTTAQVYGIRIENHPVNLSPCIPLSPAQTYYISLNWDLANGTACLWAYTAKGTFLGNSCEVDVGGSLNNIRLFSNENGTNAGTYSYYQNIMMTWSTASPSGTGTFINGSTTVTGSGFTTGNSWNNAVLNVGGAYYTIAAVNSSTTLTLATPFLVRRGAQPTSWNSR
ncbi:MAG: hypothetical protein WBX16_18555 [Candidatus Acidiferrales bacterium]